MHSDPLCCGLLLQDDIPTIELDELLDDLQLDDAAAPPAAAAESKAAVFEDDEEEDDDI